MVVERDVLVAQVRPVPAGAQPGVDPLDGAVALEILQEFAGVVLPLGLREASGLGPAIRRARETLDMRLAFATEERRDIVDRQLGGAVGVAELALPQGDPEGAGHRDAADHHGQPEPAWRGALARQAVLRPQPSEGGAEQDQHDGRVRPEVRVDLPEFH